MTAARLHLPGVLTSAQAEATADFIAAQQQPDGSIPWYAGGRLDHWDHIEAAMGLTVAGRWARARRALQWSADTQRQDGSWPMLRSGAVVHNACGDTNQSAYIAVGLWHYHLVTGQTEVLAGFWPMLEAAMNFVVRMQRPDGALAWAVDERGRPDTFALLTGSASAAQSLECALAIAATLGHDRPRWRHARARLVAALEEPAAYPSVFADRERFSMDWYYPVLAGLLRGEAARERMTAGWDRFVWPGRGVRCVDDQPWVTAAESVELVTALAAIGQQDRARALLTEVAHLRDESTGGYWTGRNVADGIIWPREQTAWSAAAVLLAVDAVAQVTPGARLFHDAGSCEDDGASITEGAAS